MDINELDRLIKSKNTSGSNFTGADFVASYEARKKNQEFLAGMKTYNQQKEREELIKQQEEISKKNAEKLKVLDGYNTKINSMIEAQNTERAKEISNPIAYGFINSSDTGIGTALQQWNKTRERAKTDANQYKVTDKWSLEQKLYLADLYAENPEKAFEFASDTNRAIDNNEIYELGKKYPIMAGIASVGTNIGSWLEYPMNLAEYAGQKMRGDENPTLRRSDSADVTTALRSGGSQNETISSFKVGGWNVGGTMYQGVLSLADMFVASIATGGIGGVVGGALKGKVPSIVSKFASNLAGGSALGISAAASATNSTLDRGGTNEQAISTGVAAFFIESLTETFSLSELKAFKNSGVTTFRKILEQGNKKAWLRGLSEIGKNVAISMGVNASEEFAAEVANYGYDYIANADISQFVTDVENYMAEGKSESEAKQEALKNMWAQFGEAAASGAFIGLLAGTGGTVSAYNNANSHMKNEANKYSGFDNEIIQSLVNEGLESPIGSDSRILAEKLQNKINNGQKILGREIAANKNTVAETELPNVILGTAKNYAEVEAAKVLGVSNNIDTIENEVDTVQNNGYNNSNRGEDYVRTDEFRDIQAESKGMSNEDIQLFHSGNREIDDGLRERFSRSVKSIFLASNDNGVGNANGILSLSAKGNTFNLYENVNGSLFHDVFEIARNYLKFGELVDLHGIQTTEDGVGYDDCYNYLSEDGLSGFSITPDGDLISVFNASGKSGFLRAISDIVKDKAKTLDCYASPSQDLEAIYSVIFGFKTASIMDYNMDYDHDGIATNHDNPKVAFMVNTNLDVETKHFTKEQYDEAKAYRDSFVKNSHLQSTAGGKISKLSAANPEYNPIEDLYYQSVGVERLTADQKKLKKVGQQFGAKVLFKDLDEMRIDPETGKEFLFSPEGQFDPETNTITLNTNVKEHHRPVEYILKHELTHSLEIDKDNYALFAVQVLRSDAFAEYVASKGFESADAWATEIIKQYSGKGVKSYQGPKAQLLANQEMVANFVGDMLFGGRTDITEKLLNNMAPAERSGFIAKIKEFFAKLKELFKGSEELTEIERLENLFLETANKVAAKNKTSTQGSGDIVYSFKNVNNSESKAILDIIRRNISKISSEVKFRIKGSAIDKTTRKSDYVFNVFKKQGGQAYNSKIGIVEFTRSGAKSTVFHGFDSHKLAATQSIKSVIEKGDIVSFSRNYENTGVDRYVIAAKGEVNGEPAYVGVVVKSYPKNKSNAKFYLHEVLIIEEDSPIMTAPQSSVDAVSESSNYSISENGDTVNNNYAQSDKQYSFAVERDSSKIQEAEEREAELRTENKTDKEIREVIWKELGIIRDTEGIWKYEINDRLGKKSQTYPYGTALIKDDPDFEEFVALIKKSNPTKKQKDRIAEISSKFKSKYDYGQLLLKHFLKHDELFAKYPQLKNVKIGFEDLGVPYEASYNSAENKIIFDKRFRELDDTSRAIVAMHEIQHAIQKIDDTEPGSSLEYWNARILKGERLPINPDTGKPYTAYEAYKRTKGEIEAREAGGRVDMTENERRDFVPEFGWENSISSRQRELVTALDSEYSSAVENGNLSRAQEMVDEVAQMFGYTERLYHQTNADFTEFNTNNQRAGKYDWELPTGAFLKPTDDDIGLSGKKQMELYANIRNPLEFKNRYAAQKYWSENIPGYTKAVEEVLNIDADYRAKVDAATDAIQQYSKQWRQKHPNENRRAIYSDAEYQRLSDKQADIIDAWEQESNKASLEAKRLIDDYIANNDYDGIIVERDKDGDNKETKSYIVFDSSQLKSAAPVTYDNSGNVVSLSERFDENQSDIRYSLPETNNSVENYTEEQYNNFGWVRYNDVLTPAEYSTLLSRYADYKHNKDKYPTTRFGEAVMHSTECPNVIMYVKGNIGNPHITKIVEIIADDNEDISVINERIIKNEYKQKPLPYQTITSMYGEEYLRFHRGKDYASFRQYRAEQEGINSQGGNSFSAGQQDRAGSSTESEAINIDRANGLKYSISPTVDIDSVIDAVGKGEMSASEAKELLVRKTLNPTEIANLPKEMADLTLIHGEPKRVGNGDEESKFYESALNSKIITDEVKQEIENDTYIKNYHSTTNKKTLRMAMRELEEGGYTRANEFLNLKAEKGSAVDVAVGLILLERYQRANRIDDALLVAEKLREIGTAAGQTVQMFSILGRFTPEMMVEYSARELKKAYEEMVKTKSQAWIDKNKTKFELTEEDIVFIKNNILFASNLEESRQKAILLAEVCARVQNKIPPESGQSIRALQRISLLLNPKTNIRNILGNTNMVGVYIASDFFGNLIDKQISKKTGIRTTGSYHLKGSGAAIKKGLYESYDDFKRGIRTKQDELNRYDVNHGGGKSFNENHKGVLAEQLNLVAKALNTLDNFTSFCLEAGDRPFFEMWFVNSLNNQMRLNNVDVPTPAMMEIARLEAEQRTWQDNNTVSRSMSQLKRTLNKGHLPGSSYGFGDFVLKFVKTPANIAKAMVEFSPIGLATAGSKAVNFKNALSRGEFDAAMQKEVVRSMSSAITGTLLYVLVAAGVALGAIELSGGGDDDKDVSNFEKYVVGIPPYSMKVFGQNITYSWNQPVGVILATVADFMESKEDGITAPWYEDLLGAFKTGTAVFTEQSFLSSLYELFSADDLATGIFDSALSEPSAFIPQFVSQIASFTDPYRRTTYHKGNAWRSAINEIIYKIPVLRKTLPEQVNILGETSKNTQYLNPWEAFISPGNTYPESSGKVAEEIYELYKLTGNNSVMPRTAPYSYTAKGENVSLTPKERNEFQRFIGTESIRILDALFDSKDYQSLNDEQKCKAIKKVYDYAYDKAKSQREYTYQTVANMTGGEKVLPKAKWDKLNKNSRLALVEDYFLTNEQLSCKGDAEKLAALFIRKSKE